MALSVSIASPSLPLKSRVKLFQDQHYQLKRWFPLCARPKTLYMRSMKVSMGEYSDPNNLKMQAEIAREKLPEAVPKSVKDFPWKKAEKILIEQLFLLGKKALKWSLLVLFIFSSLSDVIFSISRNQELTIPFGLFIGVLMTDFLKETVEEVFRSSEETSLKQCLICISCFFIVLKCIAICYVVPERSFLFHVTNGGLMQVLWLWKSLLTESGKGDEERSFGDKGASYSQSSSE